MIPTLLKLVSLIEEKNMWPFKVDKWVEMIQNVLLEKG